MRILLALAVTSVFLGYRSTASTAPVAVPSFRIIDTAFDKVNVEMHSITESAATQAVCEAGNPFDKVRLLQRGEDYHTNLNSGITFVCYRRDSDPSTGSLLKGKATSWRPIKIKPNGLTLTYVE